MAENLCMSCGACCASFRVSFYWSEADPAKGGIVPVEMTESLPPSRRCMKGTDHPEPRCIALVGNVGGSNHCSIYNVRPSTCRNFKAAWEPGVTQEEAAHCNTARARWGLPKI